MTPGDGIDPLFSPEQGPDLAPIVEALLFAAGEPLSIAQIVSVIGKHTPTSEHHIQEALHTLSAFYADTGRSFRIEEWAGGLRLATRPEYSGYVEALHREEKPRHLSKSLMESLAIIAYRQPVSKPELDFIRGVDSDYAVRRLLELGLVDVVGRGETIGKPILYGTTRHFLDQFGLASLDALPTLREVEELLNDPSFGKERARLFFEHGLVEPEPGTEPSEGAPPQ